MYYKDTVTEESYMIGVFFSLKEQPGWSLENCLLGNGLNRGGGRKFLVVVSGEKMG